VGQEVGIKRIIETAQAMGIKSPLDDEPSLALGSSDVQLLELTDAYCTVANNGMHHDPVIITKIVDKDGKTVYADNTRPNRSFLIRAPSSCSRCSWPVRMIPAARAMVLWLRLCRPLPAIPTSVARLVRPTTTPMHGSRASAPNLVVGAWVGGEYRSIHFRTGALGQGSRTALPIVGQFLHYIMADPAFKKYHGRFRKPTDDDGITSSMYMCQSYVPKVKRDTTRSDSSRVISNQEVILDENGEPVSDEDLEGNTGASDSKSGSNTSKKSSDTQKPKATKKEKTEKDINFNDL
jgi:penicillin-binding protein 1A